MTTRSKSLVGEKTGLHPRNRLRARYNFRQLVQTCPTLAPFVRPNDYADASIDFANPAAVKALNQALLKQFYGMAHWDIPPGYLCPPIPGRADYIHHVADLLGAHDDAAIPRGPSVTVLDIGIGANCVYPIIGRHDYGWRFVGSDIDPIALRHARQIVDQNPVLAGLVECRLQISPPAVFRGIIGPGETFDLSICNPPFHSSRAEAAAGTRRKMKNLSSGKATSPVLNFGGKHTELWCEGGELAFVRRMVAESGRIPRTCLWFTTLVSKSSNLPGIRQALKTVKAQEVKTIAMAQGQKQSRIVAWTFLRPDEQQAWRTRRGSEPVTGNENKTARRFCP